MRRLYGDRSKGSLPVFSLQSYPTRVCYTYRGESQKKSPEGLSDLFENFEILLDICELIRLVLRYIIDLSESSRTLWTLH